VEAEEEDIEEEYIEKMVKPSQKSIIEEVNEDSGEKLIIKILNLENVEEA
jgi:hypothetical protein